MEVGREGELSQNAVLHGSSVTPNIWNFSEIIRKTHNALLARSREVWQEVEKCSLPKIIPSDISSFRFD